VKVGPRVDQEMVIEEGLQAGETVVTEGQLRLQPGSTVQVSGGGGRSGKSDDAPAESGKSEFKGKEGFKTKRGGPGGA